MKKVGILFMIVILTFIILLVYSVVSKNEDVVSPIPPEKGIKVILLSPTP